MLQGTKKTVFYLVSFKVIQYPMHVLSLCSSSGFLLFSFSIVVFIISVSIYLSVHGSHLTFVGKCDNLKESCRTCKDRFLVCYSCVCTSAVMWSNSRITRLMLSVKFRGQQ